MPQGNFEHRAAEVCDLCALLETCSLYQGLRRAWPQLVSMAFVRTWGFA
jgi:hypothetical protein